MRPCIPIDHSIQTGSGKSYTMMGSGAALDDTVDPEDHGLIPRICSEIFERVDQVSFCNFVGRFASSRADEDQTVSLS